MQIQKMKVIEENGRRLLEDDLGMRYRTASPWQQALSEAVVKVSQGVGGDFQQIETQRDWQVVEELLKIYAHFFPVQYREYLKNNKALLANQKNQFGLLEDPTTKKGGLISARQLGTWPFELETLIRVVWPDQKFTKKFNEKFFKKFKAFATAERI